MLYVLTFKAQVWRTIHEEVVNVKQFGTIPTWEQDFRVLNSHINILLLITAIHLIPYILIINFSS